MLEDYAYKYKISEPYVCKHWGEVMGRVRSSYKIKCHTLKKQIINLPWIFLPLSSFFISIHTVINIVWNVANSTHSYKVLNVFQCVLNSFYKSVVFSATVTTIYPTMADCFDRCDNACCPLCVWILLSVSEYWSSFYKVLERHHHYTCHSVDQIRVYYLWCNWFSVLHLCYKFCSFVDL